MMKCIILLINLCQLTVAISERRTKFISYAIPDNRPLKKALGYYEDAYLNFTELTTKHGYQTEQYTVQTEDGYLLSIFRILTKCPQTQRIPVILGHGLVESSDVWIVTGPNKSLAYVLSANCYDVWAINCRGNMYSRKHIRLDPDKDPEYWEFSFDEIGIYDLPATIDHVLNVTKKRKVYYVGHSLGTTIFFVMGSLRPDYNKKIQLSIHLAPIAWLYNIRSPFLKIIAPITSNIKSILENLGIREVFSKQHIAHAIAEVLCQILPNEICGTFLAVTTGYKLGTITSKDLSVITAHLLVGASMKTMAHLAQLIISKGFNRFNEGEKLNLVKYNSKQPPMYNVSLINSPVILICSKNDWVSTLEDSDILSSKLPNFVERYVVPNSYWSHDDHLWGEKVNYYVNYQILNYFKEFNDRSVS